MKIDRRVSWHSSSAARPGRRSPRCPGRLTDDLSIWSQNWPWTPVPPKGETSLHHVHLHAVPRRVRHQRAQGRRAGGQGRGPEGAPGQRRRALHPGAGRGPAALRADARARAAEEGRRRLAGDFLVRRHPGDRRQARGPARQGAAPVGRLDLRVRPRDHGRALQAVPHGLRLPELLPHPLHPGRLRDRPLPHPGPARHGRFRRGPGRFRAELRQRTDRGLGLPGLHVPGPQRHAAARRPHRARSNRGCPRPRPRPTSGSRSSPARKALSHWD